MIQINPNQTVQTILNAQSSATENWHHEAIHNPEENKNLLYWVYQNHRNNFELWHEEDKARRDDMGFEYVYKAKRNIDKFNQQRNDCMEQMDRLFVDKLNPDQSDDFQGGFNSESPGMIVDRLSILALKFYHMNLQTQRELDDVFTLDLKNQCEHKVKIIELQRAQLAKSLEDLLNDVQNNQRSFKVYYQFKMYNDPKLNPELYKNRSK